MLGGSRVDPQRRENPPVSDTLTATFCERCGTRQEFRAPRRVGPLRRTRGFVGGLRNYIGGSDALSEAMREGMQAQESLIAAAQLDAFHASIHLCIDCRQYTCNECWNGDAGRCRSCAPLVGVDDLADRIAASLDPGTGTQDEPFAVPVFEHATAAPLPAASWPQADHEVYPSALVGGEDPGFALAVVPTDPAFEDEPVEEAVEVSASDTEPAVPSELGPMVAEAEGDGQTAGSEDRPPLRVMAWDADEPTVDPTVAAEPLAPDFAGDEAVAEAADDVQVADDFEPTPIAAVVSYEPEPVVAELEIEPAPMAAEPASEPAAAESVIQPEPEPFPIAPPARPAPRRSGPMRDRIVRLPASSPAAPPPRVRVAAASDALEVAARRAQLELLGLDEPSEPATASAQSETSQVLPYRSRGATISNREATAAAIREGTLLWEASAREVGGAGVTVQSCGGCGLALSASARFCRRCGARQAQSA